MDTLQAFFLSSDDKFKTGVESYLLGELGVGLNFISGNFEDADIGIVDLREEPNEVPGEIDALRLPIVFLVGPESNIDYKGHYRKVEVKDTLSDLTFNLCQSIDKLVRNRLKRSPYAAVDIQKVLEKNPPCSIFLRLSGDKFVKIREPGATDLEPIERYQGRDVNHPFVLQDDFLAHFAPMLEEMFKAFSAGNEGAGLSSLDQLRELVQVFGVKKDTVKLVDALVDETLKSLEGRSKFKDLLSLANAKKGYLSLQAQICAYLSVEIAKNLDWRSSDVFRKLVISSLFQNITLQTEDQAMVMKFTEEELSVLTSEEKNLVKRHMISACDLLGPLPTFTSDVHNAILSYHELPDGTGYPRGLGSRQLSQFEATFIIAVNASHDIVSAGNPKRVFKKVVEKFRDGFCVGNFEKPCKAFLKIFLEKSADL